MMVNAPIMLGMIMLSPVAGLSLSSLGAFLFCLSASFSFSRASGEAEKDNSAYAMWFVTLGLVFMLLGSYCNIMWMAHGVQ
eukprot:4213600-Heterocapsa_arctica.AAC.1